MSPLARIDSLNRAALWALRNGSSNHAPWQTGEDYSLHESARRFGTGRDELQRHVAKLHSRLDEFRLFSGHGAGKEGGSGFADCVAAFELTDFELEYLRYYRPWAGMRRLSHEGLLGATNAPGAFRLRWIAVKLWWKSFFVLKTSSVIALSLCLALAGFLLFREADHGRKSADYLLDSVRSAFGLESPPIPGYVYSGGVREE